MASGASDAQSLCPPNSGFHRGPPGRPSALPCAVGGGPARKAMEHLHRSGSEKILLTILTPYYSLHLNTCTQIVLVSIRADSATIHVLRRKTRTILFILPYPRTPRYDTMNYTPYTPCIVTSPYPECTFDSRPPLCWSKGGVVMFLVLRCTKGLLENLGTQG